MKKITSLLLAGQLAAATTVLAGSFGPGPWANGAYYPGQYDGVYSATIFGGSPSVVSGVLGFGLNNGSPSTATGTTTNTQNTINLDSSQNYFVVFVEGRSYAGQSIANINNQANKVSGGLINGTAPPTFFTVASTNFPGTTNQTVTLTTLRSENSVGGAFVASLTGKKAVIKFSGNNTGTLQVSENGIPTGPQNTFSLNGMKVGYQTGQASTGSTQ